MKIAVLDDYQNVVRNLKCFNLLSNHEVYVFTETYDETEELVSKLFEFEVLVLIRERTKITESLLSQLPNLKLISQTGKISSHLSLELCKKYNITVSEGIGSAVAPSELCWTIIMAATRNIPEYVSNLSNNKWQQSGRKQLGRVLNSLTIGIWGYGKIGKCIAQYAKVFGMNILVWGSKNSRIQAQKDGFSAAKTKADFFSMADIITLHLRLNNSTKGCVTKADLEIMKLDSLFVNTSRAELVQRGALFTELKENPTKYAALDVFENEPISYVSEPLLSLENVLCTPHIGYVEKNNYEIYFKTAFENIISFVSGQPKNVV